MATIRIYRDERKGDMFPEKCMRCGAEPTEQHTKTFIWNPGWVIIFFFVNLLLWLIVMLITRKTMRVTLPLCSAHRNLWRNRQLFVWLGLLFWAVYSITLVIEWSELTKDASNVLVGVLVFGFLLWLVAALVYASGGIRASCITDSWIELVGVDREFAREWNEMEDEDEDERPKKKLPRRRHNDEDDDD